MLVGRDDVLRAGEAALSRPAGPPKRPAATGTVMRPDVVGRYARLAGCTAVEMLPIEHPMFRFYRLVG